MRKTTKSRDKESSKEEKRKSRIVCLVSEEENRVIDRYLDHYKISNKSRWFRETILEFVCKNMEEDYPTLFSEHEMRR